MTRRQVLKRLAGALGGVLSAPVVAAALSDGRRESASGAWRPRTLTAQQDELVTALAEAILPATDTPGAREARVNEFIDLLLTEWLDDESRDRFLAGLEDLDARCRRQFDRPFLQLTTSEQIMLLEPLDLEAVEAKLAALAAGQATPAAGQTEVEQPTFFGLMKEMTLVGYYTSEIGMTQELKYLENPGSWSGCVPLAEIGRAWA